MRKDISLSAETKDVRLVSRNNYKIRDFRWVNAQSESSRYLYGEIDVPYIVSEGTIRKKGIYVTIPYTPQYKEFKVRVRRIKEDGTFLYLINEVDGTTWFVVQSPVHGQELHNVFVSMLPVISESHFYIQLKNGLAELYSHKQSDFEIAQADQQNANCLLACFPGNMYRYPLTGVGLARWINSNNVLSTDLTQILQKEFAADGITINDASYNYDTKQMKLDIEVSEIG